MAAWANAPFDNVPAARRHGNHDNTKRQVAEQYAALIENPSYLHAVDAGTSQKPNVEARIELATKAFADVK